MAGLYAVTLQSGYVRNVVNVEQIMNAACPDYVRMLVESARGESLDGTSLSEAGGQS